MKRTIFFLFLINIFVPLYIVAQEAQQIQYEPKPELQISVGPSFGYGVYSEENVYYFPDDFFIDMYEVKADTNFIMAGIDFKVRLFFYTNSFYNRGFISRGRTTFVVNGETEGHINNIRFKESLSKNDFISISDIGFGITDRINFNKKMRFLIDHGINFTIMDAESGYGEEHSYWGVGLFGDFYFQFDITKTMYLELGMNTVINIFSSQEGKTINPNNNQIIKYEDTGRLGDQISFTFSFCIGWRIDLTRR